MCQHSDQQTARMARVGPITYGRGCVRQAQTRGGDNFRRREGRARIDAPDAVDQLPVMREAAICGARRRSSPTPPRYFVDEDRYVFSQMNYGELEGDGEFKNDATRCWSVSTPIRR